MHPSYARRRLAFVERARTLVNMSEMKVGIIGGSGMQEALASVGANQREVETPFGRPSGPILEAEWSGVPVFVLQRHGSGHVIPPSQIPFRANVFALKQLGCTHILASGAVGSLRDEFKPRDLVIANQVIDKTYRRIGTFFDEAAVHVEFSEPFCPMLRQILLQADIGETAFRRHDGGCYVCMEGPAFSTRAESLMHRLWGGDLIGMTAMPEAKLAREAEISYALIALVTDYDCWRSADEKKAQDAQTLLQEIIGNLQAASQSAIALIKQAVAVMAERKEELMQSCPAHRALELAIWSDKTKLDPQQVEKLRPLWGKYFP
jgi:5'-methylthioadenosine phosphorylase